MNIHNTKLAKKNSLKSFSITSIPLPLQVGINLEK